MHSIIARNVNDAYWKGVSYILSYGTQEKSRNGKVVVAPGPVATTYLHPTERVLFDPQRDANPFFHLMEAIWMLAGERASAWPVQFNTQMAAYANPNGTYDGAYGYRWRKQFGFDQIKHVIHILKRDPTSRRAVINMYDPRTDNNVNSLDIPCNVTAFFDCRKRRLNMTVCNRSNDAVWGAYGANAVHFSVLQEVIAAGVDIPVGEYVQFSNNLHIYPDIPKVAHAIAHTDYTDLYISHGYHPMPLVTHYDSFLDECELFMQDPSHTEYLNRWFYYVARPMYLAWRAHKDGDKQGAISWAIQIEDQAWAHACTEWLNRRKK